MSEQKPSNDEKLNYANFGVISILVGIFSLIIFYYFWQNPDFLPLGDQTGFVVLCLPIGVIALIAGIISALLSR